MSIFTKMSIRIVLGQIIGVFGILMIALGAAGLFAAVERNDAARRVASLAGVSQQLFSTLLGFPRNVMQASVGTAEVSTHIGGASRAATETGSAAAGVLDSASALARLSDALRADVDRFIGDIRAA